MNANQLNRSAAKASLLIALTLLMTACALDGLKKKVDPEPELAGTYQVSQWIQGRVNFIPVQGNSANIAVTRLSDTQISAIINTVENGVSDRETLSPLTIRKTSGGEYDILNANSVRIGSVNGTDFTLDFTGNGERLLIVARK